MCGTISWPGAVTSWSFVVAVRLPGDQLRLQKVPATGQAVLDTVREQSVQMQLWSQRFFIRCEEKCFIILCVHHSFIQPV